MIPTTPWRFTTEAVYSESKDDCIAINLPWVSDLGEKGTWHAKKKGILLSGNFATKGQAKSLQSIGQSKWKSHESLYWGRYKVSLRHFHAVEHTGHFYTRDAEVVLEAAQKSLLEATQKLS